MDTRKTKGLNSSCGDMRFGRSFRVRRSTTVAAFVMTWIASQCVSGGPSDDYAKRCAVCHDNPPDVGTPTRGNLEQMGASRLRYALVDGRMNIHTQGMSATEIDNLVSFLNKIEEQEVDPSSICSDRPVSGEVVVSHWGVDSRNTRHQSNSGITSSNIDSLELKFAFGIPQTGSVRSWPAVSVDTIFLPALNNTLYAIDRDIGCVKWQYTVDAPFRTSAHLVSDVEGGAVVVVSDQSTFVHAVDAFTGELKWKSKVGLFDTSMITGSAVRYEDDWLIPISAFGIVMAMDPLFECCKSHGAVSRINGANGEVKWTAHMTKTAKETSKNARGTQMWGPSGAPVWTTPAIDEKRGVLYVGTGENTSSPATDKSDAIVAIDLETGEIKAHFQGTQDDAFNMACGTRNPENCPEEKGPDFDFGASAILVTTRGGKDLVLAGQKSGDVWALDPDDNLKLVWNNRLSNGSPLGGIHWGLTVVDDVLVVPVADPDFITKDPKPGIYGLDIESGETVWSYRIERGCELDPTMLRRRGNRGNLWPECPFHYGFSAAASSTNDLAFAGSLNGTAYAFNVKSGEIAWTYDTKKQFETVNSIDARGGAIDNPGIVVAGNQLMVLSGYANFGQMPGNVLLVFELP